MKYYENKNALETNIINPISGNGEMFLIIDDENSFVEITKLLLEYHGYNVFTAEDGVEGTDLFTKEWN